MAKKKRKPIGKGGIAYTPPSFALGWPTWLLDAEYIDEIQQMPFDFVSGAREVLAQVRLEMQVTAPPLINPMTGEPMPKPSGPTVGDSSEASHAIRDLVSAGKLLVVDQHREIVDGDRGPELDFYVGEALPVEALGKGKWRSPVAGYLALPTGRIVVACGAGLGEDELDLAFEVAPGDYLVSVYHRDLDESGPSDGIAEQVVHLKPITTSETVDGNPILLYR